MLKNGYSRDDAGEIFLVETAGGWLAIGGATRCEAFLDAVEQDPSNERRGFI